MRRMASFLTGLFAGALVAGVAVLLLTPASGTEIRERLSARLDELIEEGKRAAAARRAELQAQLEAFKRGYPGVELEASEPSA